MTRNAIALALTSASLTLVLAAAPAANPVIDWNRTLLTIVRTPGAQPPTIHTTRSFAILHAAIFDAVNSISRAYNPYLTQIEEAPPSPLRKPPQRLLPRSAGKSLSGLSVTVGYAVRTIPDVGCG
jgi:hypothetical protein